jgi:glycosyltransferase involved in cell wall biosynthesis
MKMIVENQKRIAIFLPGLYDGGAERVMLNLAEGLTSLGFNLDLILAQAEGAFIDAVPATVRLIELNKTPLSAKRTLSSLLPLVHYIRSVRPDYMLSCLYYANIIALWAKSLARVPFRLVISEHNTFSSGKSILPYYYRLIFQNLMKFTYPMADEIIAVSKGVAEDLTKTVGIPANRIKVVYNPIINPELSIKKNIPIDDPWFLEKEPPVVLAIGRLTQQKGFDILIQAFAQVRKRCDARLVILGEGEERTSLNNLIRDLNLQEHVRLPGFVTNPYPYLANADLFVLSSRWEGLPTVLVEALYCGAPIIATDCPSGPREILKDGLYGQLVPVENIEALSDAILSSIINNHSIEPDISAWQEFSIEVVLQQYVHTLTGTN